MVTMPPSSRTSPSAAREVLVTFEPSDTDLASATYPLTSTTAESAAGSSQAGLAWLSDEWEPPESLDPPVESEPLEPSVLLPGLPDWGSDEPDFWDRPSSP